MVDIANIPGSLKVNYPFDGEYDVDILVRAPMVIVVMGDGQICR